MGAYYTQHFVNGFNFGAGVHAFGWFVTNLGIAKLNLEMLNRLQLTVNMDDIITMCVQGVDTAGMNEWIRGGLYDDMDKEDVRTFQEYAASMSLVSNRDQLALKLSRAHALRQRAVHGRTPCPTILHSHGEDYILAALQECVDRGSQEDFFAPRSPPAPDALPWFPNLLQDGEHGVILDTLWTRAGEHVRDAKHLIILASSPNHSGSRYIWLVTPKVKTAGESKFGQAWPLADASIGQPARSKWGPVYGTLGALLLTVHLVNAEQWADASFMIEARQELETLRGNDDPIIKMPYHLLRRGFPKENSKPDRIPSGTWNNWGSLSLDLTHIRLMTCTLHSDPPGLKLSQGGPSSSSQDDGEDVEPWTLPAIYHLLPPPDSPRTEARPKRKSRK